jgi:hypothetical protein
MIRYLCVVTMLIALAGALSGCGAAVSEPATPAATPPEIESQDLSDVSPGGSKDQQIRNLDANLSKLFREWPVAPQKAIEDAQRVGMVIEDDKVLVTVVLSDATHSESVQQGIRDLGGEVVNQAQNLIDAKVPIAKLDVAAALPGVGLVRQPTPSRPLVQLGSNP